jgi:hypothetical protein
MVPAHIGRLHALLQLRQPHIQLQNFRAAHTSYEWTFNQKPA